MNSKPKRLFVALWPDDLTRRALERAGIGVAETVPGRAVRPENLHITLNFLGNVSNTQQQCVEQACGAVSVDGFTLALSRVGYWRTSQVLWLGPDSRSGSLTRLVALLNETLLGCGFEPEPRPYRPHVTLMRKVRQAPAGLAGELASPVRWPVSGFALVESLSSEHGVVYRPLRFWRFE